VLLVLDDQQFGDKKSGQTEKEIHTNPAECGDCVQVRICQNGMRIVDEYQEEGQEAQPVQFGIVEALFSGGRHGRSSA